MDRAFLDEAVFQAKRASLPLLPWEQGWLGRALGHTPLEWYGLPCPPPVSHSVVDVEHPTSEERVLPRAAKKPRIMGGS
eukprot:2145857-Amphidinium_carterae.1